MNTLVLNPETCQWSIERLLAQVDRGGVEIKDSAGKTVALVLSAADREARIYAEANRDLDEHRAEILEALERRGGVTTEELLRKAAEAADNARS